MNFTDSQKNTSLKSQTCNVDLSRSWGIGREDGVIDKGREKDELVIQWSQCREACTCTLYIYTYHHPSPTTVYFCFEDLIKVTKHYITTIWKSKNSRFTAAISWPVMFEVLLSIVGFILSLVEDKDLDQLGDLLLLAYDNLLKRRHSGRGRLERYSPG